MEIEGMIIQNLGVLEGVSKAGNAWKKQEWLMETPGQYPKKVKFTVFGENRVNNMQFEPGKNYIISVDIESREYNGRYYTDVTAYAMRPADGAAPTAAPAPAAAPVATAAPAQPAAPADPFASSGNDTDDLPF